MKRTTGCCWPSGGLRACVMLGLATAALCIYTQFVCKADSLADRLAGKNVPDFTVVYDCQRHNRLAGSTREEIGAAVRKAVVAGNQMATRMGRKPPPDSDTIITRNTDVIWHEIANESAGPAILTISQHAGKLPVKKEVPARKEQSVFLYDGQQSMFAIRGSDARVVKGFHYEFLRDFVFPGCGVSGIPMCRNLAPSHSPETYDCSVGLDDGVPDGSGVFYDPGTITFLAADGVEVPSMTRSQRPSVDPYRQDCSFTAYRKMDSGFMVPGTIELREWYRPGATLAYGEQYDATYKLVSASDEAEAASEFKFESQLPEKGLVSREEDRKSDSILYEPGSSIDSQFKANAENMKLAALAASTDRGDSYGGGAVGAVALLLALFGWYVYRRSKSSEAGA